VCNIVAEILLILASVILVVMLAVWLISWETDVLSWISNQTFVLLNASDVHAVSVCRGR